MATVDVPASTQAFPAGAFRRMGWAFLFLGISVGPVVRLGQEVFLIDALPDFVGYLMIATAANRLVPFARRASAVRNLALLLTYLVIPTIIHYAVVTLQSGNVFAWSAPLWPLSIGLGLLELVLVWILCGLVADLARHAADDSTELRACVSRILYIFLKAAMTVGFAMVLVSPSRELVIGGAAAAVLTGLALVILMMRLMWRAERMCLELPEVAWTPAETGVNARPGGWLFRLLATGGAILPVMLAAGAVYHYLEWQQVRAEEGQKASHSDYFLPARNDFYAHLAAGRIDEAYASTTASFQARIGREHFGELARRHAEYVKLRGASRGRSGSGASSGSDHFSERDYDEVEKGRIIQVTLTVRRDRDSLFLRAPPPVRVDDFNVEELGQAPPFGRLADPGR